MPGRETPKLSIVPGPFRLLFWSYVFGLGLFSAGRLILLLGNQDKMAGASFVDILTAFGIGLRFDTIIAVWILLPLILLTPWIPLRFSAVRWTSRIYLTVTFSLALLLLLVDSRFYNLLGTHLNFLAYEYFNEGPTFWHLILSDPMFWPFILGWAVISVGIWMIVGRIVTRAAPYRAYARWYLTPVWFLLFLALAFLGIRGRTGLSPIGWSVAYFSDNQFVNQLGLNGIYTLGRATMEEGHDPRLSYLPEKERFPFVALPDAIDSVQGMLSQSNDTWLEPHKSLLRETHQLKPPWGFRANVVIVLLESWSGRLTGCLGFPRHLTPQFDSLANKGILFTDFFANGTRSNYGISATLCGFPALPGRSIMTRYNAAHPFVALSEILHQRGYTNIFAYGGDLVFDNMEGFLTTKGYDRLWGDSFFGKENVFAKWGVPDHIVFRRLISMVDSLPRPFNLTVFTLSNHEPFDLPDSSVQRYRDNSDTSRLFNVQLYADRAIGQFIDQFKSHASFDSTIFVFVSDHTKRGEDRYLLDPVGFQIPLLIYAPGLIGDSGRRVHTVGGQIDVIPTLMGFLGGDYRHASWGRNLLTIPDDSGFAFIDDAANGGMIDRQFIWRDDFHARTSLLYRPDANTDKDRSDINPKAAELMKRRLRLFFQAADQLSTPTTK
ncbi:MAG: LTA synthase family protein [candidate division Zixibacteria bacterium]|nr:LTA synthase family protein [candidate division Zixibacteria bacterium]